MKMYKLVYLRFTTPPRLQENKSSTQQGHLSYEYPPETTDLANVLKSDALIRSPSRSLTPRVQLCPEPATNVQQFKITNVLGRVGLSFQYSMCSILNNMNSYSMINRILNVGCICVLILAGASAVNAQSGVVEFT